MKDCNKVGINCRIIATNGRKTNDELKREEKYLADKAQNQVQAQALKVQKKAAEDALPEAKLTKAAGGGDLDLVKSLLKQGAKIDKPYYGYTALIKAVIGGHEEMVRYLIDQGADVKIISTRLGSSALHYAATFGRLNITKRLLKAGADPWAVSDKGYTAISAAYAAKKEDVALLLREAVRGNSNLQNSDVIVEVQLPDEEVAALIPENEVRIALVIGNGNYPNIGILSNPPNDANLMAKTLEKVGFEVIKSIDVNQKEMKRAISKFGQKLTAAGKDAVGLFYYAGHGLKVGGVNYLIPVNVEINSEADVDMEGISANSVLKQMEFAGNRLNVVIMDACRNNPFKRGFRSVNRGLARMDATSRTLIAYATSPGDVAEDGDGSNSPYTEALSKAMLTPGLTIERVFKKVRNSVVKATNKKQVPWEASSLIGDDFYLLLDANNQ